MTNLFTLIDQYAAMKSAMGKLEAEKKALEKALAELPAGAYESEHHRLTISDALMSVPDQLLAADQKIVAQDAIEAYRGSLSRQYLAAHTIDKNIRSHRIGLPTGKNLAA